MAVWGAPSANEDDAERAVRAALDLVASCRALDPALQARAGVLTGEAAVTLGATDQGMVAGDLVNTASRIQSAAEPGTVLVGETTKRATEAAVVYADAGDARDEGQGRADASCGGRCASSPRARARDARAALEAPFVGRDRELRLVKELFHAAAADERAASRHRDRRRRHRQVAPRLGVREVPRRARRSTSGGTAAVASSYGEGVAYWALAEMVRRRAGIAEDEDEPRRSRSSTRRS